MSADERQRQARETLEHFAELRAKADLDLLDRVLSRQDGEAPGEDDRVPRAALTPARYSETE